jgi:hypothetical protein
MYLRDTTIDVFSRNIYADQQHCWFGGLTQEVWDGVGAREEVRMEGRDRVITRTYHTRRGPLTERQRYIFADSTLVQEKFLLDETADPLGALEEFLQARRWRFLPENEAAQPRARPRSNRSCLPPIAIDRRRNPRRRGGNCRASRCHRARTTTAPRRRGWFPQAAGRSRV